MRYIILMVLSINGFLQSTSLQYTFNLQKNAHLLFHNNEALYELSDMRLQNMYQQFFKALINKPSMIIHPMDPNIKQFPFLCRIIDFIKEYRAFVTIDTISKQNAVIKTCNDSLKNNDVCTQDSIALKKTLSDSPSSFINQISDNATKEAAQILLNLLQTMYIEPTRNSKILKIVLLSTKEFTS